MSIQAESIENEPVVSDVHTLILAGDYDPVTRRPMHKQQRHWKTPIPSFLAVLTWCYHFTRCGAEMAKAFVDTPDTAPDADCMTGSSSGL